MKRQTAISLMLIMLGSLLAVGSSLLGSEDARQHLEADEPEPFVPVWGEADEEAASRGLVFGTPDRVKEYIERGGPPESILGAKSRDTYNLNDVETFQVGAQTYAFTLLRSTSHWYVFVNGSVTGGVLDTIASGAEQIYNDQSVPAANPVFGVPPDQDANGKIICLIGTIDGPGNTAGFFQPGDPNRDSQNRPQEIVYVDISDIGTGTNALHIMAHEYQHLIGWNIDQDEFLFGMTWFLEGLGDYAIKLTYGIPGIVNGHLTSYQVNTDYPFYYWQGNVEDYGVAFLYDMYLQNRFGTQTGHEAITYIFQDTANGRASIENLAHETGPPYYGNPAITISDLWSDFMTAMVIDAPTPYDKQFGFGSIYNPAPTTHVDVNSYPHNGAGATTSWGFDIIRFHNGGGSPLNLHFNGIDVNQEAQVVAWSSANSQLNRTILSLDAAQEGYHTLPDFGTVWDEVYMLVTYKDPSYRGSNSSVTYSMDATLITTPPSLIDDGYVLHDLDNDSVADTVEVMINVSSTAFGEPVTLNVEALDSQNNIVDAQTRSYLVGGTSNNSQSMFFSARIDDDYHFRVAMIDSTQIQRGQYTTTPVTLTNLAPGTVNISSNASLVQTWEPIQLIPVTGDNWGLYWDTPYNFSLFSSMATYDWDLGDGNHTFLQYPVIAYRNEGNYSIDLTVTDAGGAQSTSNAINVSVINNVTPVARITSLHTINVGPPPNIVVDTYEEITSSGLQSTDNTPSLYLNYLWDFGDGTMSTANTPRKSYTDGSELGQNYTVTLTVSDEGGLSNSTNLTVIVNNQAPYRDFTQTLVQNTLSPIFLPLVYNDVDGLVVTEQWNFSVAVDTDGAGNTTADAVTVTNPQDPVYFLDNGTYTATVTAIDDDGGISQGVVDFVIVNQAPVADFNRCPDQLLIGNFCTDYIGETDTDYTFDGTNSFDPDQLLPTETLTYNWSVVGSQNGTIEPPCGCSTAVSPTFRFNYPGLYYVTLTVTDIDNATSTPLTYPFQIGNKAPVAEISSPAPGAEFVMGEIIPFSGQTSYDEDGTIVEWTWDFGDQTPPEHGHTVSHIFNVPGPQTITLTVRDDYKTGETNQTSITIHINNPPSIRLDSPITVESNLLTLEEGDSQTFRVTVTDEEEDAKTTGYNIQLIYEIVEIVDGATCAVGLQDEPPGCQANEHLDKDLIGNDTFSWAFNDIGEYTLRITAIDSRGTAGTYELDILVVTPGAEDDDGSEFTLGSGSLELPQLSWLHFVILGLAIMLGIILFMQYRQKVEEELESAPAPSFEQVNPEGFSGILGMDHHVAPPPPKKYTAEDRTSDDSGYRRPLLKRRY